MGNKILIIDDNAQDRKIMERFLNKAGFAEILFAEKGEEGIEKVRSERPDLAIIDTLLPGIDGFEVCRQIRQIQGLSMLKIIIITGFIDAIDAVKAKRMGADDYCVKTSDFAPLIESLKELLK